MQKAKQELDKFLKDNIEELQEDLVYEILQTHGSISGCINFALEKKEYEKIFIHHLNEHNYK